MDKIIGKWDTYYKWWDQTQNKIVGDGLYAVSNPVRNNYDLVIIERGSITNVYRDVNHVQMIQITSMLKDGELTPTEIIEVILL